MQKVNILTLGCKVNEYESRVMRKLLQDAGYEVGEDLSWAEYYIINSCAVTAMSEKKSRQMMSKVRQINPKAKILVCGCASEHNAKQFLNKGAFAVIGNAMKTDIVRILKEGQSCPYVLPLQYEHSAHALDTQSRQYIKVQDGCNNFCSYCLIPYVRGRSRSRLLPDIIEEIQQTKCNEIVLTGIDVSDYQIAGKPAMLELIKAVDKCNIRFRLSSLEQGVIDENLIKYLAKSKNFCPHFHLSLQSGSNSVLKRMNRKYTREQFLSCVDLIKRYFGDRAVFTTDIITGFIGETEQDFLDTYDLCQRVGFYHIHAFPYSERQGTKALMLQGERVPVEIAKKRVKALETLEKQLRQDVLNANLNKTHHVLVEKVEDGIAYGYTENYIYASFIADENVKDKIVPVLTDGIKNGVLFGKMAK